MRRNMRGRMSRRRFLGSAAAGAGAAALGAAGMAHAAGLGSTVILDPMTYNNPILISAYDPNTDLVIATLVKDDEGNNFMTGMVQVDAEGLDALYGDQGVGFTTSVLRGKNLRFVVVEGAAKSTVLLTYLGCLGGGTYYEQAWDCMLEELENDDYTIHKGNDLWLQVARVSGQVARISANGHGTTDDGRRLTLTLAGGAVFVPQGTPPTGVPFGPLLDIGYPNHVVVKLH